MYRTRIREALYDDVPLKTFHGFVLGLGPFVKKQCDVLPTDTFIVISDSCQTIGVFSSLTLARVVTSDGKIGMISLGDPALVTEVHSDNV